jgi:integrase
MGTINFTNKELDKIPEVAKGSRASYSDIKVVGLTLRVTHTGVKSFIVRQRINGKRISDTLGHYPAMTITQARNAARLSLNALSVGINPNNEKLSKKIKSITLKQVMNDYVDSRKKTLKEKTIKDYWILFNGYLSDWQDKQLVDISRSMVGKKHGLIGEKTIYRANATMRLLRALFNYAIGEYEDTNGMPIIMHNPVQKISHNKSWFREKVRTNIIEPSDLKDWFTAVIELPSNKSNTTHKNTSDTVRDYLIMLLFTGLRPSEGINLEWSNIDFKNKLLSIADTKNHEDHTLPLSEYIIDLLLRRKLESQGKFVFPGYNPNKALVDTTRQVKKVIKESGVNFLLHDLRRTFATYADSLEIKHTTIKRLMNHKDNDVTTKHYIQPSIERLREPMQKISNYILEYIK